MLSALASYLYFFSKDALVRSRLKQMQIQHLYAVADLTDEMLLAIILSMKRSIIHIKLKANLSNPNKANFENSMLIEVQN